jgi:hypothetical protein
MTYYPPDGVWSDMMVCHTDGKMHLIWSDQWFRAPDDPLFKKPTPEEASFALNHNGTLHYDESALLTSIVTEDR